LNSDRDIPVLELDLEYGQGESGQVRVRAEAFVEMLQTKHFSGLSAAREAS